MPTPVRRRLRVLRRTCAFAVAGVLVLMALVLGTASQVLPLADSHPERIAAWLSVRAGEPVHLDRVHTQWTRRGPLLQLEGLRIGEGADSVRIGEAEVLVSMYGGLLPGRSFTELRLRGLSITLQRSGDGRWSVAGLPMRPGGGDPLQPLQGLGELQLIDGRMKIDAPSLGLALDLPRIDLRLQVERDRVRTGLRAWIDRGRPPLEVTADLQRGSGNGRAYANAAPADLAAWAPLLRHAGVGVVGGTGNAEAWVDVRDHRVSQAIVQADLQHVVLEGAGAEAGAKPARLAFGEIHVRTRWQALAQGWRVDTGKLRIGDPKALQNLDGLAFAVGGAAGGGDTAVGGAADGAAAGNGFAFRARQVDAGPLLAVAALSDRVPAGLRAWLQRTRPTLRLDDVSLAARGDGRWRGSGRVSDFGFAAIGESPGVAHLAAQFSGDEQAFELAFAPGDRMRFDWPRGFGIAHEFGLDGRVLGWREGDGWDVQTASLRLAGKDVAVSVRGGVQFQGDGTRPRLDIAADVDDTKITTANGFWVRNHMPDAAVRWLEGALVGGEVRDGHALVSGDLDDWPFTDNDGRFEATARITNGAIRFQHDWPAMEQVDANVVFLGNGFSIDGHGSLGGVPVAHFNGEIPDFALADLAVDAETSTDAGKLLAMLKRSPLQAQYRDTFDALTASGPASATYALQQPLTRGAPPGTMKGTVVLDGARLADKRYDLAFDNVRGKADFDHGGFAAQQLSVRMAGAGAAAGMPGTLALRAGSGVKDPAQAFEASLSMALTPAQLLDRAPQVGWLKPYLAGRSQWDIAVDLPKAAAPNAPVAPGRLRMSSSLVGTALTLPAPLAKGAAASLPTRVEARLPMDGNDIDVVMGKLIAVRARSSGDQTGVRIALGTDRVDDAAPPSGLIATGRVDELDALDWIGVVKGSTAPTAAGAAVSGVLAGRAVAGVPGTAIPAPVGGGGLQLRRIDVRAQRLHLIGGTFPDTRVQVTHPAATTQVVVDGAALAGTLAVPDADGATVEGHLSRVHWRSATAPAAGALKPANAPASTGMPVVAGVQLPTPPPPDAGADMDPAAIPPLRLDIADLRVGDATLGATTVRTHAVGNGLHVDQLQVRGAGQDIDVTGSWTGRGSQARTQMRVAVKSTDFGALLNGLGVGGRLGGGTGTALLDAGWPGSPAGFRLANLQGSLNLDARDGRLLEVNPGAGRVLGLLSIAELPRRLTLDFRDFFSKGFAFNRMGGTLAFGGGLAKSDDLAIEGPAADIRISGSADLRAERFDQTIDVRPKSGNLLTAVGAVAAGPVGAAVGALANAVLNKPLSSLGAKTYRVTGPWQDPDVQVQERREGQGQERREGSPAAAPTPAPTAP